jgi:Aspartyl protease
MNCRHLLVATLGVILTGSVIVAQDPPKRTSTLKASSIEVPMRFRGLQPALEVFVNGEGPFLFAIDTGGAGEARLDSALAKKLNLKAVSKVQASAGPGTKTQSFDQVRLDSLTFGGVEFQNITAMVRDYNRPGSPLPHIDGILGFGLFADYLLTLDYPAKQVRVEKGALPKPDNELIFAYEAPRGVPMVELAGPQGAMKAIFDTGSMGGFLMSKRLAEKLPLGAERKVVGKGKTVSGEFTIEQAPLEGELQLGSHRFPHPKIDFAEFFENAIVGNRVFADFRLTFDQINQRVRLTRQEPKK